MWGMTIAALRPNALEESRKLKPEIPMTGIDNIPLLDEIELELAPELKVPLLSHYPCRRISHYQLRKARYGGRLFIA